MNRKLTAAFLAAAAGTFWSADAFGATRTWNAPNGGTWSTPATNWLGGVVPVSGDTAVFDLSDSYTVDFIAPAVTNVGLVVRNDTVTFDLSGFTFGTTVGGLTGGSSGDISRLTITNGTLSVPGSMTIALAGGLRQTVTASSGGTLTTTGQISVGDGGEGSLVVLNGGAVNAASITLSRSGGGTGTLLVSGLNSSLTTSGELNVGSSGHGVLSIAAGANVAVDSLRAGLGSTASAGSITVSGSDTSLTVTNTLALGVGAVSAMRVDQGASVTSANSTMGFTNGVPSSAVVDGLGSNWSTGTLTLSTGSLMISNGAHVGSSTITLTGVATVTDASSTWNATQFLVDGELNVLNDGKVSVSSAGVTVGSNGTGSVRVSGPDSTMFSGALTVGVNGNGNLTVEDRALVSASATGTTLGSGTSGFGTATVRDVGSSFSTGTALIVGASGTGVLVAENGGAINEFNIATVAMNAGSRGTIRASGSGSRFTAGSLVVGNAGAGNLIVEDGALVSVASTGTLNVGSTSTGTDSP